MPANLDFGSADFSNWEIWIGLSDYGSDTTGPVFTDSMLSAPIGGSAPGRWTFNKSRHSITSGSDTDYYGGFPVVCPDGGPFSLRLGNDSILRRADRVRYYVHVPAGSPSYNLQYQYAMVTEHAGHGKIDQPILKVVAYDSATGDVIPNANNMYIAKWSIPGFTPAIDSISRQGFWEIEWLPWTRSTLNLSDMAGKTVILECTAFDCAASGHFGYAYFDVVSVADTLQPAVLSYNAARDSVVFEGPPGYKTYGWFNQDFSVGLSADTNSASSVTLPVPELNKYYNLVITPYSVIGVPDTIRTQILRSNVGISSKALAAVRAYPNPASTVLHLSAPLPFDGSLQLVNSAGACVYRRKVSAETQIQISTADLAAGMYNLILDDKQGGTETRKVLVGR